MDDFRDSGVDNVRISGHITASTSLSIHPVPGYPDDRVIHLGFYRTPVIALHADDEQLRRLRDAIDEYLGREAGASDA